MNIKCIRCKGSDPISNCGRQFCPIIAKSNARIKVNDKLTKQDFFGSAPAPFVGRFGYPNINVGILSPSEKQDNAWELDAPRHWAKNNYQIPEIIDFRSSLINSRFKSHVKQSSDRLLEISQEVGIASKPVDVEINLDKAPAFAVKNDNLLAPTGPSASLRNAKITENPKVHTKVDKVVSDTDLKAADALQYLYEHNFDENFLSKILSVGTLGIKKNRKLVPTRWSITAADDTISKNLISQIKNYNEADYTLFFDSYLGNYYLILLFPDVWSYELFETYFPYAEFNPTPDIQYTTDYESYKGRTKYAENCAGGYYAARLPILEKLSKMKRQASVLCLRFITGEYATPLGVWVCREATRKSITSKPIHFNSQEEMLNHARYIIKRKFNQDLDKILSKSILLKEINTQMKLHRYFS